MVALPATPTTDVSSRPRTGVWGTAPLRRGALRGSVVALALSTGYWAATGVFAPEFQPGWLEFAGTVTSLACVWITRRENVLSLPIGIVSVVLMGVFFFQIGLVGQGWLHVSYYLPVQIFGWWMWIRGGPGRTDLSARWLPPERRFGVAAAIVVGTIAGGTLLETAFASAVFTYWDASIVAASVVAQWLLSTKRVDSYLLWMVPVNVSAIGLFFVTGAYMFSALYILYLLLAVDGLRRWAASARVAAAVAA